MCFNEKVMGVNLHETKIKTLLFFFLIIALSIYRYSIKWWDFLKDIFEPQPCTLELWNFWKIQICGPLNKLFNATKFVSIWCRNHKTWILFFSDSSPCKLICIIFHWVGENVRVYAIKANFYYMTFWFIKKIVYFLNYFKIIEHIIVYKCILYIIYMYSLSYIEYDLGVNENITQKL